MRFFTDLVRVGILILISSQLLSAQSNTVSMGTSYTKQVWYSLQQVQPVATQAANNWDLAFEVQGFTASIRINDAQGVMLWTVPNRAATESDFQAMDTSGLNAWPALYNSDTSWSYGAFNRYSGSELDLGWGIYNMMTHIVSGDSLYVIRIGDGSFRKLWIQSLAGGSYNFRYSMLDNSEDHSASLSKSPYAGKNFAYYSLRTNSPLDREPLSSDWDLLFTRYMSFLPAPYPVTGILSNAGVLVAEVKGVDPETALPGSAEFSSAINTIGYDWKSFVMSTNSYKIADSTVYFVKRANGDMWRLRLTGFGGNASGDVNFEQTKLETSNIRDEHGRDIAGAALYPNPALGEYTTLVYWLDRDTDDAALSIFDCRGNLLLSEPVKSRAGLLHHRVNTAQLPAGEYMLVLRTSGKSLVRKLVVLR